MQIIVAGASGRLGQNFLKYCAKERLSVVALVRKNSYTGNISAKIPIRSVDYSQAGFGELKQALADATHIVNLTGSTDSSLSLNQLRQANVQATKMLLDAAPSKLEKFVHLSSISVYGKKFSGVQDESSPRRAYGNYGISKLEGEQLVLSYANRLNVIILQPGMIYGPGFKEGFYPVLKNLSSNKMAIVGSGENHIPLVHIDDVSKAIACACASQKSVCGSCYLIVTEPQLTQNQLMEIASAALKVPAPSKHINYSFLRLAACAKMLYNSLMGKKSSLTIEMIDQLYYERCFSSKKATSALGWKPSVSFKMGIEEVVNQFQKEQKG
ncbi:MAG: NAD-dependent epimerase/dehydratase family protein [Candidatus Micrarchaeia archaeon]